MPPLHWLPLSPDWRTHLRTHASTPPNWPGLIALARARLDFLQTQALDATLRAHHPAPPGQHGIRLGLLGSATMGHLHAAIRVAAARRNLWTAIHENAFGQYRQELLDPASALHAFAPNAVLFAFDAAHLTQGLDPGMDKAAVEALLDRTTARIADLWALARQHFAAGILHQLPLPTAAPLLGENEHRLPASPATFLARLSAALRPLADARGVDLISLDHHAARDGLAVWHDRALWLRARQEIAPPAAPFYGDLVARLLAARQGLSGKCLVLDLDNTLWGGVVGDDGVAGLALGPGSALGEAFAALQTHIKGLAARGVILAVCSKNEEAAALAPFDTHPGMVLKRTDIACFIANWTNKADNLRTIAQRLNIGLDALVFLDDNPAERALVRQELPMVAVPEWDEDPLDARAALADGGYFEAVAITAEDRARGPQYQAQAARAAAADNVTDLPAYLRGLAMRLSWRHFDAAGLPRIVQLINKSNQFNLTARRYTQAEVEAIMADPSALTLQLHLADKFGDHGIIAIVIGRLSGADLYIGTWLMSCRVLGRGVENATLGVLAEQARAMGARRLIAVYRPSGRNGLVAGHYAKLGFTVQPAPDGGQTGTLDLAGFAPARHFIDAA